MRIRTADPADFEELLRLVAAYYAEDGHVFSADTVSAGLVPLLEDHGHGLVWVVEGDDGLLGYAVVTWGWSLESGGPDALLDEIYVEVGNRRRGVGSLLIRHLIEDCRRRGMRRIFLETERPNGDARRLYRRLGFEEEQSVWMSYRL